MDLKFSLALLEKRGGSENFKTAFLILDPNSTPKPEMMNKFCRAETYRSYSYTGIAIDRD